MMYEFNYVGKGPPVGEIKEYKNTGLNVGFVQPVFITYTFDAYDSVNLIPEPIELLLLSTTNPAHSICEIISFYDYYSQGIERKIGVNTLIIEKMPYLWQLIQLFIPPDRFIILQKDKNYAFSSLTTRRNAHFIYTNNWSDCAFTLTDNVMSFKNLQGIRDTYSVSCESLFSKIKEIYDANKHRYQLHDSIMIIKTTKEKLTVTPHRALEYPNADVLAALEIDSIHFVEVSKFADIYEYICALYHAKRIIFSYGGPMCINRFFCNPEASVVVLANLHYRPEYEYDNATKTYWHVRHAMLAPVRYQTFLLDFPNRLTLENINLITKSLV